MKKTTKQTIEVILMFILIFGTFIYIIEGLASKNNIQEKKIEIMQKAIKSAKQPSQIERLGWKTEESRRLTELNLAGIKNLQEKYEFNILTYRCFKDQVNRLMNNKEVDEEFCNNKDNLNGFRLKK